MHQRWHSYEQLNSDFHKRFGNRLIKKQNKGRRVDKAFNLSNKISQNLIYLGEIFIVGLFSFSTLIFGNGNLTPNNTDLVYPLQEASTIDCRSQDRASLTASCKVELPIIKWANFAAYQDNPLYRDIYTVLFGGHYKDGWANTEGSHYGVDIASAKGTPLYAIANGKVYFAGQQAGYGNVVKIQFMYNGVMYFATYGHMDQILVKTGQPVSKGQKIWTIGNSWSVMWGLGGYHVHFEINKNTNGRPVFPFYVCKNKLKTGIETINAGLCRDEMYTYNLDPIIFLEEAHAKLPHTDAEHSAPIPEPSIPAVLTEETLPQAKLPEDPSSDIPVPNTSSEEVNTSTSNPALPSDSPLVLANTTDSLLSLDLSKLDAVGKAFFAERDIRFEGKIPSQLKKWEHTTLTLKINHKNSKQPFSGVLKQPIILVANSTNLSIDPVAISFVQNGEVQINISAQQSGPVYTAINLGLSKIGGFVSQIM